MVMDRSLAAARDPYDVCGKGRHKYAYNVRARQLLYKCLFWNPQLVVLRSSTTKIFIMVLAHLCASTRHKVLFSKISREKSDPDHW